jgi:hypothetical protein
MDSQIAQPGVVCSPAWWREQVFSYANAVYCPVLLHGAYDVMLFVASGECGAWAWLYLPCYLGVIGQVFYIRARVFSVERRYPAEAKHDVHAKIKSGEVPKPCVCAQCGAYPCCACCECCY